MPTTFNMSDVMISYSRRDKVFVQQLEQALRSTGREIWVDWQDIPPTVDFLQEIYAGIEAANTFIFVISPDSAQSKVCGLEVKHAVSLNKRLIPIQYRELSPEDRSKLDPKITSHNWINIRQQDNFEDGFKTLLSALDTDMSHVQMHTKLLVLAREWENENRSGGFLLRGEELKDAENWLTAGLNRKPEPTALQAEYIAASRKASARRRQIVGAATTAALVIVSILALFAFQQSGAAHAALDISNQRGTEVANQNAIANAALTQASDRETARAAAQQSADDNLKLADDNATLSANNAATANANATLSSNSAMTATSAQSTAGAAQDSAHNSLLTATAAQGQVGDVALTATYAQGQAYNNLLTATFAQGEGQNALLTSEAAQKQANTQATQAAINQAAANTASTLAAQQQQAALQAQKEAANAQGSAIAAQNDAATARANAAVQQGKANAAGTQAALALIDASQANADANVQKTAAAVAINNASTAKAEATEALGTAVAAEATAEFQSEQAQSLSLASFALSENVNNNHPIAIELALLSVLNSSNIDNIPATSRDILRRISYSTGLRTLSDIKSTVKSLAITADNKYALSGDTNGHLLLWNIDPASPNFTQSTLLAEFSGEIQDFVLTPNGMLVVAAENFTTRERTLAFYRLNNTTPKSLQSLRTFTPKFSSDVLAVSRDGKYLASAAGYKFRIFNISNIDSVDLDNPYSSQDFITDYCNPVCRVVDLSFLDDTTSLLASYNDNHPVYPSGQTDVYDLLSNDGAGHLHVKDTYHLSNIYGANAIDPLYITSSTTYQNILLVGIDGGRLAIWENGATDVSSSLYGHTGNVNTIAIVGDRAISGSDDTTIRLWDIHKHTQVGSPLLGHTANVRAVAMNADATLAISGSDDGTVRFWDTKTGADLGAPAIPDDPNQITTEQLIALVKWACNNRYWQAGIVVDKNLYGVTQSMLDRLAELKKKNCDLTQLSPLKVSSMSLMNIVPTPSPIPTPEITLTPTETPTLDPSLPQVIDAGDTQVVQQGSWQPIENPQAKGGSYLISGTANDSMTLTFQGTAISVIYFQHPAMGSFNLELDGTLLGSVRETGDQVVFRQVPISGLTEGTHTLRFIVAQNPVVIDAFVVNPPIDWLPVSIVTATPSPTIAVTPTLSPVVDVTLTPTSTEDSLPDVTLTPSATATTTDDLGTTIPIATVNAATETPTPTAESPLDDQPTVSPTASLTPSATATFTDIPPTIEVITATNTELPTVTPTETSTLAPTETMIPISDSTDEAVSTG